MKFTLLDLSEVVFLHFLEVSDYWNGEAEGLSSITVGPEGVYSRTGRRKMFYEKEEENNDALLEEIHRHAGEFGYLRGYGTSTYSPKVLKHELLYKI